MKKLYYSLSEGEGESLVMGLSGCMEYIRAGMEDCKEGEGTDTQYTLTPIWLTDVEFDALPEQ